MLKQYYLDPNELSFEATNITDVNTCAEEILSNNKGNVEQSNPHKKIEMNKSTELNESEKKEIIASKPEVGASKHEEIMSEQKETVSKKRETRVQKNLILPQKSTN